MFWSLILEPGKTYSSTVKESFHLSMATLDVKSVKNDTDVFPVVIEIDGQQLLLCNLCKPHNLHANLDLVFQQGTNLTFSTSGKATIHLTGYCIQDDVDDDMEGYSSSEDEEDESFKNMLENYKKDHSNSKSASKKEAKGAANQASPSKRKLEPVETISKKKPKVPKDEEEDDDDSSLDDEELGKLVDSINDEDMESDSDDDLDDEEDDDEDGGEDSDELESDDDEDAEDDSDDSDEESEDEKRKQPVAKGKKEEKTPLQNKQNKTPISNKKQDKQGKNQLSNGLTPQSSKKDKKEKNQANQATPKQDAQKTPKKNENASPQPQKKQTTVGGVIIEELKAGNGPVAKAGKMVSVYYTGRLKSNNRVFDQTNQGPGFKFRLGNNEVIKGWDIGVSGMKVGSKRRITCPPGVAYGNKGSPPQIPPNSTLVFEVELKSVN